MHGNFQPEEEGTPVGGICVCAGKSLLETSMMSAISQTLKRLVRNNDDCTHSKHYTFASSVKSQYTSWLEPLINLADYESDTQ